MRTRLWIGLDIGADEMAVCGTNTEGNVVFEHLIPTDAAALHAILKFQKRRIELISLETGHSGIPLTRALRKLKYPVAVFDARQASKFLTIRRNKTDRNDARGLAEIGRLGRDCVSEVHVKSPEMQRLRSVLVSRQKLVQLRTTIEGNMRSLFRLNGGRLKSSSSAAALRKNASGELIRLRKLYKIDLSEEVEPLLALSAATRTYVESLDRKLSNRAESDPVCRRFLEIPGVGPICALSFYSAIEDPARFRRNSDVGVYLGLVPKLIQSGQMTSRKGISKMGDPLTRSYLATAALHHLRFGNSALTVWGAKLVERIGKRRTQIAVARKLAITMIAMWKSNQPYDPRRNLEEQRCSATKK